MQVRFFGRGETGGGVFFCTLLGVLASRLAWLNCRRFLAGAMLLERGCGVRRSFLECLALAWGCVRRLGALMTKSLNKVFSSNEFGGRWFGIEHASDL